VTRKSDRFVQEFVLIFGFLGGLFTWAGVDPEEAIIRAILEAAIPNNGVLVSLVIVLFVVISTFTAVLEILKMAGQWGLFVVGMAWISGLIISISSLSFLGVLLLIGALILGPIVCDNYKPK
jgi:hypothetical protein